MRTIAAAAVATVLSASALGTGLGEIGLGSAYDAITPLPVKAAGAGGAVSPICGPAATCDDD